MMDKLITKKTLIRFSKEDDFIIWNCELAGRILEEHTEIINGQRVRVIDRIDNINISVIPEK